MMFRITMSTQHTIPTFVAHNQYLAILMQVDDNSSDFGAICNSIIPGDHNTLRLKPVVSKLRNPTVEYMAQYATNLVEKCVGSLNYVTSIVIR